MNLISTVVANDGVRLGYRVLGSGPNDVLLVHGWAMTSEVWQDLLAVSDARGLRFIIPDARGGGASDAPPSGYTLERLVQDLVTVVEHARSAGFVVVGHSMGGQLAQWLAATEVARVRGLVLLNTVPASGLSLPADLADVFRSAGQDREKLRAVIRGAARDLSDGSLERLVAAAMTVSPAAVTEVFEAWSSASFAERLAQVRAPTLVVATDDPTQPLDLVTNQVLRPLKPARLAYLPGAGHYPQVERPRETAALLQAFLAAVGASVER